MTLSWSDHEASNGLVLSAREGAARPWWRFEAAAPYLLRLSTGRRSLLWARIDPFWHGADLVRDPHAVDTSVVPPMDPWPAREREIAEPGTPAWSTEWARFFARALAASARAPMCGGLHRLSALAACADGDAEIYPDERRALPDAHVPPPYALERARETPVLVEEQWYPGGPECARQGRVLATRPLVAADGVRVRAWRRAARAGTLPPVLLGYHAVLAKYLVLDGHVRLEAALEAGVTPPLLGLWPVREVPAMAPASAPLLVPRARAWALEGGRGRWAQEVRARLSTRGAGVPPAVIDAVLAGLAGLER